MWNVKQTNIDPKLIDTENKLVFSRCKGPGLGVGKYGIN